MITKVFYSNPATAIRAQVIIMGDTVTLAKFNTRGERVKLVHRTSAREDLRRRQANEWHAMLVGQGFKSIERR